MSDSVSTTTYTRPTHASKHRTDCNCPRNMWSNRVYATVGCPSVCLSVPSLDRSSGACGGFAAECRAGRRRRSTAASAEQQRRRSTALSSTCGQCRVDSRVTRLSRDSLAFHRCELLFVTCCHNVPELAFSIWAIDIPSIRVLSSKFYQQQTRRAVNVLQNHR